jgi:Mg2+/Co2+ transporter CorC
MRDLAGLEWKDEDVTTVGGYVVSRLGHLPRVGEQVHIDGYTITVEQADDRRSGNFTSTEDAMCHEIAGKGNNLDETGHA